MEYRQVLQAGIVLDGKYRIDRVLGSGGFGITYEAFDLKLAAPVAIKEYFPSQFGIRDATYSVRPRTEGDREIFGRLLTSFLREARTLNQFEHPAIVRVLNVFEGHGTAYMVMKYEGGPNLKAWLARLVRLPTQTELDRLTLPLLDALEMMHSAAFLHRDIAPDNIIVRPDGTPVLLDFGASRRIMGEITGTLTGVVKKGYSPQEQYATDSRSQGPWTDIYALGATLYRCVSGEAPEEATERMLDDRLVPAVEAGADRYRHAFLAAIDAAMVPRPKDRPQSIAVWREMLFDGAPLAALHPRSWPTVGATEAAGSAPGESQSSGPRSERSAAAGAHVTPLRTGETYARRSNDLQSARRTEPSDGRATPDGDPAGAIVDTVPSPRRRKIGVAVAAVAIALLGGGALVLQTATIGPRLTTAQSQATPDEPSPTVKSEEEWRRAAEEARRQHEVQLEQATREAAQRATEETRRQHEEEARQRAAEASRKRAAEEARRRKLAEEAEARRIAEDVKRREAEAARRSAEEEARRRELAAEMEARRKAEEAHRQAVQEAQERAAELARQRKLAEEAETARRAAEAARQRQEQEVARLTREAAERASEETRRQFEAEARTREAAAAKKPEAEETTRIAALPKLPRPAATVGAFDGTWNIVFTAIHDACRARQGNLRIHIHQGQVTVKVRRGTGSGRITASGGIRWTAPARFGPLPVDWTGTLRGNSGWGTYITRNGRCNGRFSANRL